MSQETGKQGTWAQCSIPSCGKWRFLQTDIDPQEIPERWVCSMNESKTITPHYTSPGAPNDSFLPNALNAVLGYLEFF